jgi:hypothetical protein
MPSGWEMLSERDVLLAANGESLQNMDNLHMRGRTW